MNHTISIIIAGIFCLTLAEARTYKGNLVEQVDQIAVAHTKTIGVDPAIMGEALREDISVFVGNSADSALEESLSGKDLELIKVPSGEWFVTRPSTAPMARAIKAFAAGDYAGCRKQVEESLSKDPEFVLAILLKKTATDLDKTRTGLERSKVAYRRRAPCEAQRRRRVERLRDQLGRVLGGELG